jgi:hypothetical protein
MVGLGGVTTDAGRVEVTDLLKGAWEDAGEGVKDEEEEEDEGKQVEKEEAKEEGRLREDSCSCCRCRSGSCPSDPCGQLEWAWADFSRCEARSSVGKEKAKKGLRMSNDPQKVGH